MAAHAVHLEVLADPALALAVDRPSDRRGWHAAAPLQDHSLFCLLAVCLCIRVLAECHHGMYASKAGKPEPEAHLISKHKWGPQEVTRDRRPLQHHSYIAW